MSLPPPFSQRHEPFPVILCTKMQVVLGRRKALAWSTQLHGEGVSTSFYSHLWDFIWPFHQLSEHIPLSPLKVPGSMSCDRTQRLRLRTWRTSSPSAMAVLHIPGSLWGYSEWGGEKEGDHTLMQGGWKQRCSHTQAYGTEWSVSLRESRNTWTRTELSCQEHLHHWVSLGPWRNRYQEGTRHARDL